MSKLIHIEGIALVIPEKDDPCDLWIAYFERLQKSVGASQAKTLWLITWKSNGKTTCTTRPSFNRWLSKQGLDVSNLATRTVADLSAIQGNLFGLGKNLTKVLAIGVPLLLVALLVGVFMIGKKVVDDVELDNLPGVSPLSKAQKLLK